MIFVDTNVLVYARDLTEPVKQKRAEEWITGLWHSQRGRISQQVLNEYYVTVTRKLRPGLPAAAARADVRALRAWTPVSIDASLVDRAWTVEDRFRIGFRDAMIVAAAQVAGCSTLLTEDLQAGARFGDMQVVNPFRTAPSELG